MKTLTPAEINKLNPKDYTAEQKAELVEMMEGALEVEVSKNRVAYFKPYPWQQKFIDSAHEKMTVFAPASNKIGKTIVALCIAISWMKGYEPWNEVDKTYPGSVQVKGKWYKASSLGIKPPVDIVMCGEDWKEHIGKTLVPEFKKWACLGDFKAPRKNEQGIENFWVEKNIKSTLTFMCYTQDDKVFESSKIDGALLDEPPPQGKYEALKRGLYYTKGKTVITATPLSEPWLLDKFVLTKDPLVGVMSDLTILDNPDKYNAEKSTLLKMGLSEAQCLEYFDLLIFDDRVKKTCVKDQGRKAENFIRDIATAEKQAHVIDLSILEFVKNTHPDKAPARFHGTFRALVGKIYKDFDRDKHIIEAMTVKPDWVIVPCIDWHPGTEIALSFYALTEHGMMFVIDEIFKNMNPADTANIIIDRKEKDKWRIDDVIIDALARGDTGFIRNRQEEGKNPEDTFDIIEKKLKPYKIKLMTGSRDRDSGIVNMQTKLKGPNGIPTIYYFDSLQSNKGAYGHLFEIERWTRDDKGKIKEEYNHFMVNSGWVTLSGIKWSPITPAHVGPNLERSGSASWMGG